MLEDKIETLKQWIEENGLKINRNNTDFVKLRFKSGVKENGSVHNVRIRDSYINSLGKFKSLETIARKEN